MKSCKAEVRARASKLCLCRIAKQSVPVIGGFRQFGGDDADRSRASAGVKSRQRLPSAINCFVEDFQDFVLETAAFAGVQFKNFSFVGAQS